MPDRHKRGGASGDIAEHAHGEQARSEHAHDHSNGREHAHALAGSGGGDDRNPPQGLTRNESLVWDTLADGEEPLKAYEILDQLKGKGVRAPMTVYRALEGLEEKGFIHKLEGMNSFVVCNHEGPHEVQVFLVCEVCGSAKEIQIEGVRQALSPALRREEFQMNTARLEARGRCVNCLEK